MLHTLKPNPGSRRKFRRVGRGHGSGRGTTAGRGQKGQQSRAGRGGYAGFEGGQTPLLRRLPKAGGFRNPTKVIYEVVNLKDIESRLEAGSYDVPALRAAHLVRRNRPVKILGEGAITKKFDLTVNAASRRAKKAIEEAGGKVTVVR